MPIITLLTDFGVSDSYVGEVKGVLLTRAPNATLVDISHEVHPGDIRAASYILGRTWKLFPPGTVHFVVVDPGVGTERGALAVKTGGHFFVGPDNGVFSLVLGPGPVAAVVLSVPLGSSTTFHGRDVFAAAAGSLATSGWSSRLGVSMSRDLQRLSLPTPKKNKQGTVEGEVIYVDRFGNLITNLESQHLQSGASLWIGGVKIDAVQKTFGQVSRGQVLAYFGSGGTLEIAVRDGSAAQRLSAGVGTHVRIERAR
jgi:S-adenosyl-L-methionine hydrolase (adenosine-forming)